MKKILLVLEEYPELVAMEILLKKVGFDTIGLTRVATIDEKMLSFVPDVLIALGAGTKVNGMELSRKYRNHETPKIMLVFPMNSRPSPKDLIGCRIDSMVSTPVDPEKLLSICAKLCGQPESQYVDKLRKILDSHDDDLEKLSESQFIQWKSKQSLSKIATGDEAQRVKKYKNQLADLPAPEVYLLDSSEAKEQQKKLEAEWDMERVEKLNIEKRAFAKALFDKESES